MLSPVPPTSHRSPRLHTTHSYKLEQCPPPRPSSPTCSTPNYSLAAYRSTPACSSIMSGLSPRRAGRLSKRSVLFPQSISAFCDLGLNPTPSLGPRMPHSLLEFGYRCRCGLVIEGRVESSNIIYGPIPSYGTVILM